MTGEISQHGNPHPGRCRRLRRTSRSNRRPRSPETAASDQPDGATTVVKAPQNGGADEINTADIQDAHVTLPEGMTLNPSAANGLEACTPARSRSARRTRSPVRRPRGSERSRSKPTCRPVRSRAAYISAARAVARSRVPRTRSTWTPRAPRRVRQADRVWSPRTRARAGWKRLSWTTHSSRSAN